MKTAKKMIFILSIILFIVFLLGAVLFYVIGRGEIKQHEWRPLSVPYSVTDTSFQTTAFQLEENVKYELAIHINYNEKEAVDQFIESTQGNNSLLVWELTKEGKTILQEKFTNPQGQTWGHGYTEILMGRFSVEKAGLYALEVSTLDKPFSEKLNRFSPYLQISVNSLTYKHAYVHSAIFYLLSKICLFIGLGLLLLLLILKFKSH